MESQVIEYKSLKKVQTGDGGMRELSKTCVCLANAQGGTIVIGFEDKTHEPPEGQRLEQSIINKALEKLRGLTVSVGLATSEILTHDNGGEYFEIKVYPSQKVVATTTDGRIYMRIADSCVPVHGEDLQRIVAEKDAFQWELVGKSVQLTQIPTESIRKFTQDIRNSSRVKASVKEKGDVEVLEHYRFLENGKLTNLGVLWLGNSHQRAKLSYPITVQYIVYDALEQKTRKYVWDDYEFNPQELLHEIEREAVELNYFYEIPDGLFRTQVRHYRQEVIRELLVNAFAHKSYLISADIMIEVYPDRMEITSPGSLPLGITRHNILHEKHRRNPHLIKVMHDLKLMEGEGSGYDLIYEKLTADAKTLPIINSDFNKVMVRLEAKITNLDALRLTDYISKHYQLTQREKIVVGVVARHHKILSTQLSAVLQLSEEDRLRSWVQNLVERKILLTRGKGKGNAFIINPALLKSSELNISPSLKTIEPHVLAELVKKDLEIYPQSSMSDIDGRIKDVPRDEIKKVVYSLVSEGVLRTSGANKNRQYELAEKK
jgi:ATP-dependent DNA helicase RecG